MSRCDGPPELDCHPDVGEGDEGERGEVLEHDEQHAVHLEHGQQHQGGVSLRLYAAPSHATEWLQATMFRI